MQVKDVCRALEAVAPPGLAAEWDNVGLLVGDARGRVRKLLLCIDLTAEVMAEARSVGAQMVMAYHPVIFKGVSRVTTEASPMVFEAARRGVAVYSTHTALDAAEGGTNDVLADVLGLADRRPLEPVAPGRVKVVVFLPSDDLAGVAGAAFAAGAGVIGEYHSCSFFGHGVGTFYGGESAHPTVGRAKRHEAVEEVRLEMVAPRAKAAAVCEAIRRAHSYETPAVDVYPLLETCGAQGQGRVGRLERPAKLEALIARIKKALGVRNVLLAGDGRRTSARRIGTAAVAAGSAGKMWRAAAAAGATLYLTGEMRHHEALAAATTGLSVVCVGHSHSERLALTAVAQRLRRDLPELKTVLSRADRDPFEVI